MLLMKRKIIKQGPSTLMISIPHAWAKQHGLTKGTQIEITERDDALVISTDASPSKTTTLSLAHLSESSTRTAIVNAYRLGYDKITLSFDDSAKAIDVIDTTLKEYLLGFEVTSKGKKSVVIEAITEPSNERFDVLFAKILHNIGQLIEGTVSRLEKGTPFRDYNEITMRIHRYDNFCRRVATKTRHFGDALPLFYTFSNTLIHAQRELYHLNRLLDKSPGLKLNGPLLGQLSQCFSLLREGYVNTDVIALEKLHALEKTAIYEEMPKMMPKKPSPLFLHIGYAIKNFYLASSPLIGLILAKKE